MLDEEQKKSQDLFADEKALSRHVQAFQASEYWKNFAGKLQNDLTKFLQELVNLENPTVRGKIQYIQEILSWYDAKAQEEESFNNFQKQQSDEY